MSSGRIMLNKRFLGSSMILKIFLFILLTISLLFQSAWAGTALIRLAWDPNTEPDVAGYRIYFGTSPRTGDDPTVCGLCGYSKMVDRGNGTAYRIPGLIQAKTYYISATAYDTSNNESVFSDEISGPAKEVYINFDGDGKTDISVYHSASGIWFIKPSLSGTDYHVAYGGPGYIPVPGDYDRDGETDIAVYHSASGLWFIKPSLSGTDYHVAYGGPGYIPVPGDYDGDGKTDIAVYHEATGLWFIKPSSGAADYYLGYGGTGYVPVPGDYDGDGKTDIAVYHSATGLWFIKKSSDGTEYYVGYGGSAYIPINSDYLLGWVY
jgi:hypothetical protein